jgi:phosphate transport system permease protein
MLDTSKLILRGKRQDAIFNIIGILFTLLGIVTLGVLVADLLIDGLPRLSSQFLTSFPSRNPARAGILSAWVGTLMVIGVTLCTAVPIGVAAAVYLEEYAKRNWFTALIEINISNLAGVPSIIYGLMALGLLVYQLHLGRSVLVGGLTLALLVLPIVIVSTREAIRAIPSTIREAAYAAGATKWQVIRYHLIPYSLGGIATGTIIAMSRAIGETAPLITIERQMVKQRVHGASDPDVQLGFAPAGRLSSECSCDGPGADFLHAGDQRCRHVLALPNSQKFEMVAA